MFYFFSKKGPVYPPTFPNILRSCRGDEGRFRIFLAGFKTLREGGWIYFRYKTKLIQDIRQRSIIRIPFHLQERFWRVKLRYSGFKNFFHKNKVFAVYFLAAFFLISGIFGYALKGGAAVAKFYPVSCLGGWQNPQNAQGKPDVKKNASAEEFNENNSAVLRNVISQIFCGSFEGEIPENSQAKKVLVKFSWAMRTEEKILANEENSEATSTLIEIIETTSTIDIISTSTSEEIIIPETSTPEKSTSSPVSFWHPIRNFISNGVSKIIPLVLAEETSTPEIVIEIPIEESSIPPIIEEPSEDAQTPASASEEIIIPETLTTTETATTTDNQTATSSQEKLLLATSTEEDLLSATTQETILTLENTSPSTEEIATTTPITPPIPEPFLEIFYTFDGVNWQSLDKVNQNNWQNLKLEIPNFNWEDISKLQISIQSLSPVDFIPTVYLDGMWLEVEYEISEPQPLPEQETDPNLSVFPNNTDLIKELNSGNIRVILINEGGFIRLWYAIDDKREFLPQANITPSNMDSLLILDRTIFWLSEDGTSVFGWNFDLQDFFSYPIESENAGQYLDFLRSARR